MYNQRTTRLRLGARSVTLGEIFKSAISVEVAWVTIGLVCHARASLRSAGNADFPGGWLEDHAAEQRAGVDERLAVANGEGTYARELFTAVLTVERAVPGQHDNAVIRGVEHCEFRLGDHLGGLRRNKALVDARFRKGERHLPVDEAVHSAVRVRGDELRVDHEAAGAGEVAADECLLGRAGETVGVLLEAEDGRLAGVEHVQVAAVDGDVADGEVGRRGEGEHAHAPGLRVRPEAVGHVSDEEDRLALVALVQLRDGNRLCLFQVLVLAEDAGRFAAREGLVRIAQQTMDIYAPLANRLGIWQFKSELEDLAFRYLNPEAYESIRSKLDIRGRDLSFEEEVEVGRNGLETGRGCNGYYTGMLGPDLLYPENSPPFLPPCSWVNYGNTSLKHREWLERPCDGSMSANPVQPREDRSSCGEANLGRRPC